MHTVNINTASPAMRAMLVSYNQGCEDFREPIASDAWAAGERECPLTDDCVKWVDKITAGSPVKLLDTDPWHVDDVLEPSDESGWQILRAVEGPNAGRMHPNAYDAYRLLRKGKHLCVLFTGCMSEYPTWCRFDLEVEAWS
jgi:hypothetical protein